MQGYHEPVLLREILDALVVENGQWYLDCTLGDGGHSLAILREGGNIVGLDVDPQALKRAENRFSEEGIDQNRFKLIRGNFRDLKIKTETMFRGIIFDLGVSSLQLEDPNRGFSFSKDGPLDMRMDPQLGVTALDLIRGLNKGELYELFTKLGEEKHARALAKALVSSSEIKTTEDLARLVEKVVVRRGKIHPATQIFQALRIAVNDELNSLKEALPQAEESLEKNGVICVISFHSLEDRIVKTTFRNWQERGLGETLKKPIIPNGEEIYNNPRSRSAKLRVFRKSTHDNT